MAIQGAAAGHFVVEAEAILTVQGRCLELSQTTEQSSVGGVVTDHLLNTGKVAVAAGTVFTSGRTLILLPSGSLEEAGDGEDISVDATSSGCLEYHPSDGPFDPLGN